MSVTLTATDKRDLNDIFARLFQLVGYTYGVTQGGSSLGDIIANGADSLGSLVSTANGYGASLVGVEDAAGNYAGTDTETILAEIATSIATKLASNSTKLPPAPSAAGKIVYDNASAYVALAAGAANRVLHSNGAAAPTWGQVDLTADVTGALPVANLAIQTGSVTLISGTKTINTGITIAAGSTIWVQLTTPGGVTGAGYKISGRVNGGPGTGTFIITSIAAADGSTVVTDTSVINYWILG